VQVSQYLSVTRYIAMSSINVLVKRLEHLDKQLTPEAIKSQEEDASLDEFQRVKKRCARQVQEIRKAITERDELLEKVGGSANKTTVEMSARVRTQLRQLREDAEKLKEIQLLEEKKAAKAKKPDAKAAAAEKVDHRKEVVDLVFSHMEECETLEKKRLNVAGAAAGGAARSNLLAKCGKASYAQKKPATETSLKDLDDPELTAGLQQLQENDRKLDAQLDQIGQGVARLKNIALDMNAEIKTQGVMIEEITDKVDKATDHLQGLNAKIKDALEQVGGASRIIVNVILLVVVIAIGAFAYTVINGQRNGITK